MASRPEVSLGVLIIHLSGIRHGFLRDKTAQNIHFVKCGFVTDAVVRRVSVSWAARGCVFRWSEFSYGFPVLPVTQAASIIFFVSHFMDWKHLFTEFLPQDFALLNLPSITLWFSSWGLSDVTVMLLPIICICTNYLWTLKTYCNCL